jgi:hypothetical protein
MRISGKAGPVSASAAFAYGLNPVDLPKTESQSPRTTSGSGLSAGKPAPAEKTRSADPHLGLRFWVDINKIEVAGFSE